MRARLGDVQRWVHHATRSRSADDGSPPSEPIRPVAEGLHFAPLEPPVRVADGADVRDGEAGIEVRTNAAAWHTAAAFPVRVPEGGPAGDVFVAAEATDGRVGLWLSGTDQEVMLGDEAVLGAGERAVLALPLPQPPRPVQLVVRNASPDGTPGTVRIFGAAVGAVPTAELRVEELPRALRDPGAMHDALVSRVWPPPVAGDVAPWERSHAVPLRVSFGPSEVELPDLATVFDDELGRVVLDSVRDLQRTVATFDPGPVAEHISSLSSQDAYLAMNAVRVVRLVEALRRRGVLTGRLLEVGAWFGSFALPLARLGYDVTAVDRYVSYGDAFEAFVGLMRESGVDVVSTSREDEEATVASLGPFDVAFSGAVIEHVPHTPRAFLERLVAVTRPGGLVAVDTPNVARYWNRRALAAGRTVFQSIEEQFWCQPPWEGHHREYTAPELTWMLEQVGCSDVEAEWFDYNLFQFDTLSAEHADALCRFLEDPSQCDTLLAVGKVSPA